MRTITLEPILDQGPILLVGGDGTILDSNLAWTQFVASCGRVGQRPGLYDLIAFVGASSPPTAGLREMQVHHIAVRDPEAVDEASVPFSAALFVPIVHRKRDTYLVVLFPARSFHPDALRFAELLATDRAATAAAARLPAERPAGEPARAVPEDLVLPIEVEGLLRNALHLCGAAVGPGACADSELPATLLCRLRAGIPSRRIVLGLAGGASPGCPDGVWTLGPRDERAEQVRWMAWPSRSAMPRPEAPGSAAARAVEIGTEELPAWLQREFAAASPAGGPPRFVVATAPLEAGSAILALGPWSAAEPVPPDERALVEMAAQVFAARLGWARREKTLGDAARRLAAALEAERAALGRTSERLAPVAISAAMAAAVDRGRALASIDRHYAVCGESGTGRRMLARYLTAAGPRRAAPIVEVSCRFHDERWLREDLLGDGGSPGAHGKLWLAEGGTLILGDADRMPPSVQAALVAALGDRSVLPDAGLPIMVATCEAEPERLAQAGVLHPDFAALFGARVVPVPPLSLRPEDLVPLAARFVASAAADLGREPPSLSARAVDRVRALPWTGNVRELKGAIEAATAMADRGVVDADHLPAGGPGAQVLRPSVAAAPPIDLSFPFAELKQMWVDHFERAYIDAALRRSDGNLSAAARLARMDKKNFHEKASRLGLAGAGAAESGKIDSPLMRRRSRASMPPPAPPSGRSGRSDEEGGSDGEPA